METSTRAEWGRRVRPAPSAVRRLELLAPAVVGGLTLAGLVLWMAWRAGGYFPPSYLTAGAVALVVDAVLLAVVRVRFMVSTPALVALGTILALGAWTGLSSTWSSAPSAAVEAMQRDLAYAGMFGLAVLTVGSGRYARHVVWGVLAVGAIICGAALIARLFPDVITEPPTAFGTYRLSYPLTYWNTLGALAAMTAVLGAGLAADPRTHWALRGTASVICVMAVVVAYLTASRGAWLALFVGLLVLMLLGAHRGSLILSLGAVAWGAVAAIGRIQAYPALTDNPGLGQGKLSEGHAFGIQLVVVLAFVGAAVAFIGFARSAPAVMRRVEQHAPRVVAVLGMALAGVFLVGYGVRAADADGFAARGMVHAQNWVSDQWDEFMDPAGAPAKDGTGRLTAGAQGTRSDLYRVALDQFGEHPLGGAGAGSFRVRWIAERPIGETVTNAHSLEIETLAELGLVGILLLGALIATFALAGVRARIRSLGLPRSQVAAVTAALCVWLVHSAVDWDWQMAAVTVPALVLGATLLPDGRGVRRRERPLSHELMEDVRPPASAP